MTEAQTHSSVELLVAEVAEAYQERLEHGEQPDPEEYALQYPEHATVLRQVLASLRLIRQSSVSTHSEDAIPADGQEPSGCLGDFKLIREIGRGGMGVVYEAEQISLRRRVALKVLPFAGALDARQLQRFKNEAQAAAGLHHTNIVPVHFVGCERGVHFYAMQYIEGQTLADLVAKLRQSIQPDATPSDKTTAYAPNGEHAKETRQARRDSTITRSRSQRPKLPSDHYQLVAQLGIQAAEALDYAHQMGIVHRDVKPANLMLSPLSPLGRGAGREGSNCPRLWVTDFGLAQFGNDTKLTMTGDLLGTLRYMSPEQALAQRVVIDHRTDVYSLGATLYELLTLEPVFDGKDRQEVLRQIAFEEPKTPRRINGTIPPELETIVLKALEKDPLRRYATAKELADDLRRYSMHEPIKARRPSLWNKARKWTQRRPGLVRAVMLMLTLSVIGLGLTTWLVWREKERTRLEIVKAQKLLAQNERANDILGSVFKDLNPLAAEQEDRPLRVLLGERLDRATQELDGEGVGDPLVVAKLQMTLGRSQHGLGYADKAISLFNRALVTRTAALGPVHADTLESAFRLARAYWNAGQRELSLALHEETFKLRKANLGLDHSDTLDSMNSLAVAYKETGKIDRALPMLEECFKLRQATLGPAHLDTINSMHDLALAYRSAGKLDLALPLAEATLKLAKAKLGPDHPYLLDYVNSLASVYLSAGKYDLAFPLFEETFKQKRATLGGDHPRTLLAMRNLAVTSGRAGKHDLAVPLSEDALRLTKAKLGSEHPDTIFSMSNLAVAYKDAGKHDLAGPIFEETLGLAKAKLGSDHPTTLECMLGLAQSYQLAGKLDLALPLYEETLRLCKASLGADHSRTLGAENSLVAAYRAAGKLDLNLTQCEERLKLTRDKLGPDHPQVLDCINNLAVAYRDAGKLDLALSLCTEALERKRARLGSNHPSTLISMGNLASFHRESGKLDLAMPLYIEALERKTAKLGTDHPSTLISMDNLANAYRESGRFDLALPLHERTIELYEAKLGPEHPDTLIAMSNLGGTYRDVGRLDQAIAIHEKTLELRKAKLGLENSSTHKAMSSLAADYRDAGKLNLAIPLHEEALRMTKAKLGPEHQDTLRRMHDLAETYTEARRYVEAVRLAEEQLSLQRRKLPVDGARLAKCLALFGQCLLKSQRPTEAEPLLRECLDIRDRKEPDVWTTFQAKALLGNSLLAQDRYAETEPLLLVGYEGMLARERSIPAASKKHLTEALERLIQLYEALNKPDEVARWRKELEERKASTGK